MKTVLDVCPKTGSRGHFVPVDLDRLVDDLAATIPEPSERRAFRRFADLFVELHHIELRGGARRLARLYRPFEPDRETISTADGATEPPSLDALIAGVEALLLRANFVAVSRSDLDRALARTSPFGLEVSVDLDDYDAFRCHCRGRDERREERRSWRSLWLGTEEVRVPVYRRVFMLLKPKSDVDGDEPVHLRLFKDVPQPDLEMFLPNTRVRMRAFDKWKLGLTGGGGTVGGLFATITKLGAAANPTTWALALAGLAGVLWRQLARVLSQRTKYTAALARRLYFHTLAHDRTVLARLLELAESQDAREALLAYGFLRTSDGTPRTAAELDQTVERHLRETYELDVDFEVGDGLARLTEAGVATADADGTLRALAPDQAFDRLDARWDALFDGARVGSAEPSRSGT